MGEGAGVILLSACLLLAGCAVRLGGGPETDRDRLRRDNLELQGRVAALENQLKLREAQVAALTPTASPGGVELGGAALPRVVALRFDKGSGAIDTDNDDAYDTLRVYLRPVDAQGRFLVCLGEAIVQAVVIEPGKPAAVLAERRFSPPEFDAAYRSGFGGTHYTLELPLPAESQQPAGPREATVKVTFTDAATGVTLTQQQPMPIRAR